MAEDKTIQEQAQESVESTLASGQSVSVDGMSVSKASLKDAHSIMVHEDDRQARRSGRRPLFRGLNISGVR